MFYADHREIYQGGKQQRTKIDLSNTVSKVELSSICPLNQPTAGTAGLPRPAQPCRRGPAAPAASLPCCRPRSLGRRAPSGPSSKNTQTVENKKEKESCIRGWPLPCHGAWPCVHATLLVPTQGLRRVVSAGRGRRGRCLSLLVAPGRPACRDHGIVSEITIV